MFYERLKAMCDLRGTSITAVIRSVGGSTGSVAGWKNGRAPMSDIVVRCATHLDTSTDYLLGLTDDYHSSSDKSLKLNDEEIELIVKLRSKDPIIRKALLSMAFSGLKEFEPVDEIKMGNFFTAYDYKSNHKLLAQKLTSMQKGIGQVPKHIEGDVAAGVPIYAIPEDHDAIINVPPRYQGKNFVVVRARGDSMQGAGIDNGDYCVFQTDAYADSGLIMWIQIDDMSDTVGSIKRVFLHGEKIELRSENPKYDPLFYPAESIRLMGVLRHIIHSGVEK